MNKSNDYSDAWRQETNYGSSQYSTKYYANARNSDHMQREEYRRKGKEDTVKDEYTKMREAMSEESVFNSVIFRITLVIIVLVGYDISRTSATKRHAKFVSTQRELVESGLVKDKETPAIWSKYIDKRQDEVSQQEYNTY